MRSLIKSTYLDIRESLLRTFVRPSPPASVPKVVHSLLVITDRRLGDVCLSIPIIQSLKTAYPDANLTVLLPRYLHPLVRWACQLESLVDYDKTDSIMNEAWDVVIDLSTDYHLKSARL